MWYHRQDNQREKGGKDLFNSDAGCAACIYNNMRNMYTTVNEEIRFGGAKRYINFSMCC